MLDELSVSNLGVIRSARVNPGAGMVVCTGETGTGKTMLLGALRLLAGEAAAGDLVGPHDGETAVEGRFLWDGEEAVAARRITVTGESSQSGKPPPARTRAYLNGAMAPAKALAEQMEGRFEIVGRHDRLTLSRPGEVRELLDRRLPSAEPVTAYRAAWERMSDLAEARRLLGGGRRELERELDLLSHQTDEINRAGFEAGEDEELKSRLARLQHAEALREWYAAAGDGLDRAGDRLGEAVAALRRAAELDPGAGALLEQAEAWEAELTDARAAARALGEGLEADPEILETVNERLRLLGDLRRKYGDDIAEINLFRDRAAARSMELADLLRRADAIDAEWEEAQAELEEAGAELRAARRGAAEAISAEAVSHLTELGFTDPVVEIAVRPDSPGPAGAERVEALFASDRRLHPGPVKRVASGGELSRLILSLRLASGSGEARVVAFDEIDSGVGGATALTMGAKLAALAEDRQVFCVTHLPQVAAFADTHLVVERRGAEAVVREVEGPERLRELTRMLSGLSESERGREHAEELRALALSRRGREAPAATGSGRRAD